MKKEKEKKEYEKSKVRDTVYLWKYLPEEINLFERKIKIYGKTEKETDAKFARRTAEIREQIKQMMPENHKLKSVILSYFMSVKRNDRLLAESEQMYKISEESIFDSEIDKDIEDLTIEEIGSFYSKVAKKYTKSDMKKLNKLIKKAFSISGAAGLTSITIEQLDEELNKIISTDIESDAPEYIPTPEDLDKLLGYCLNGETKKFWSNNTQKLAFVLLTGLNTTEATNAEIDIDKLPDIKVKERVFRVDERTEEWLRNGLANGSLTLENGRLFKNTHTIQQAFFTSLRGIATHCLISSGMTPKSLYKGMLVRKVNEGMPIEEVSKRYDISVTAIAKYCKMYKFQENVLNEMQEH